MCKAFFLEIAGMIMVVTEGNRGSTNPLIAGPDLMHFCLGNWRLYHTGVLNSSV